MKNLLCHPLERRIVIDDVGGEVRVISHPVRADGRAKTVRGIRGDVNQKAEDCGQADEMFGEEIDEPAAPSRHRRPCAGRFSHVLHSVSFSHRLQVALVCPATASQIPSNVVTFREINMNGMPIKPIFPRVPRSSQPAAATA